MFYQNPNQNDELFPDLNRPVKTPFYQKKGMLIAGFFSLIWIIFVIDYLKSSGWWAMRFDLSPAEFIGGMSGLLLPIVIAWLVSAYFDRSEQLEYEAGTLKSYLNELVYPSAEGAVYTKTLTDALRAQIKEFRSVFNQLNQQTQEVRRDLRSWIEDLSKIVDHVDNQTVASVQEMANHIHDLAQATEIANEQAKRASTLFAEQAALLNKVAEKTCESVGGLSSSLSMNMEEMQNVAHGIETVNERTAKAVENAQMVSGLLQEQAKHIESSIGEYENSAKHQNARLFGNLEKVLSVFRAQGDLLDQEVEKTANRLHVAEGLFSEKTKGLFQMADESIFKLSEAAALFDKKTERLQSVLTRTKEEFSAAGQFLPAEEAVSQTDFLAGAQVILNRLQAFSVDMAHIWTPKQEESLWKQYYAGDKAVFMRHIAKSVSETQAKKMRELFRKNKDFKTTVTRYMAEFEGLTQAAKKQNDNNLLMGILLGSDVGRLYMVLADVLKRED